MERSDENTNSQNIKTQQNIPKGKNYDPILDDPIESSSGSEQDGEGSGSSSDSD
jgi:hypothetical protein